jgi:hypothetical protein
LLGLLLDVACHGPRSQFDPPSPGGRHLRKVTNNNLFVESG